MVLPLLWACASLSAAPRELRVGVYSNEPKVFVDGDGKAAGIFVDLLQLVAAREQWTLKFVPCDWQACLDALRAGQLDLMPDVARSPEREALYSFHALPVLHSWSQIYRTPGSAIHSLFDLQGKRVAVLRGSVQRATFVSMMDSFGIQVSLVDASSLIDAFALVQRGEADAVIANHLFGNFHSARYGVVDTGIVFQPATLFFAAGPGRDADVLEAIDRSVQGWRSGADPAYTEVLRRWGVQEQVGGVSRLWWWGLGGLLVFGLLAALAALLLRREVQTRTRHLQDSEQKLATILDSVGAFIYIKGRDYRYQYANHHTLKLFGKTASEVVGHEDSIVFDAATAAQLRANDRRVLEDGETLEAEEVNTQLATGETRVYLSVKIPLRHADGSIHALCGISTDITERRKAEESLQIAATVFESFEGMIVTGPDQRILKANQAYARLTGYAVDELVGQTPRLLHSGRQDAAFYAGMHAALRATGMWQGEVWNRRKDGSEYPAWITITAVRSPEGGITHYVGTQTDISSRKAAEEEIRLLAFYDPLTGLPNRRLMTDRLQHSLVASARAGTGGALLFVDLDNFKDLNDTQGHELGDQLLRQVAARLTGCVRMGDTVARLGGDEFIVLLEGLSPHAHEAAAQAEMVGRTVLQALGQSYLLGGLAHHSACSIGIALYADARGSVDELLKHGDMAMYQAKGAGRNTLRFFDPRTQANVTARTLLEAGLREGLRDGQFLLHYQAQISAHHGVVGAEALVRWQHPLRGLVSPAEFIPVAEASGLIVPLGAWILRAACLQLVEWARDARTAHWTLAVNVSARQFRHSHFVDEVLGVLEETGANPQRLKLELTETLLLDDVEDTIERMEQLRGHGVGFSLDDFGTGYSSLSYLKRLPLDQLKIDQGFVRDLLTDADDASIARTIVTLAHSMDLGVIAEGVETREQRDMLASLGCHTWQGYLFGRPGPAAALQAVAAQEQAPVP
ncbi:EAL domain-containing protein [Acidovorax sp. FJL06]|uniref:EAL domain-containing protein n=1 Tax=Acidovorax sp. FJL06 TaxID=2153365 RepID=UPI000F57E5FB|nr:EAL domain-containing protein [Acidovorax sp. FJL06]RQO83326.1 diguanylate cyclase [Acidovorax sp. FJL06]